MTDLWLPIPIPMRPANDRDWRSDVTEEGRARGEREALEMMQKGLEIMRRKATDWSEDPTAGSVDLTWLMRAEKIASEAHAGQVDKGGAPYIEHPRRVSAAVTTIPEKIVALLHDVVEDCPAWTLDRLRAEGFGGDIIEAVDAMTKRKNEDYFAAILRARANTIARVVKLADLADNSDRSRLDGVTEKDERRLEKYARATMMLRESDH